VPDYPNRILRDDLLAQLRAAKSPRTAAELRRRAPRVPAAGVAVLLAPRRAPHFPYCGPNKV